VHWIAADASKCEIAQRGQKQSQWHKVPGIALVRPGSHDKFPHAVRDCRQRKHVPDLPFAVMKRLPYLHRDDWKIVSHKIERGVTNKSRFQYLPSQSWVLPFDLFLRKLGYVR
jgi:hypothetical protein